MRIKITYLFIFIIILGACSKKQDIKIKFSSPFIRITRNAAHESGLKMVEDGYLNFGFFAKTSQIKAIKKIILKDPQGNSFQSIDANQPFAVRSRSGGSGFLNYGNKIDLKLWLGVDLLYDVKHLPPSGNYTFLITLKNDKKIQLTAQFQSGSGDPIQGFPSAIQYHPQSKKITWKGTQGQSGYRVRIFLGKRQGLSSKTKNMVFSSGKELIVKTDYTIPKTVVFQKGSPYYVVIDAIYKIKQENYVHSQDDAEKVGTFIGNKQQNG